MTTINHLPTELVSLIVWNIYQPYDYLYTKPDLYHCALVNKTFYTTTNPILWRSPELWTGDNTEKLLNGLLVAKHPVGRHIRSLDLHGAFWMDEHLLPLMKHANRLKHFSTDIIFYSRITNTSLQLLPRHCPGLTSLSLAGSSVSQLFFDALGQHCHQLRQLNLRACSELSATTFSTLQHCPLEKLYVGDVIDKVDIFWNELEQSLVDLYRFSYLTHLAFLEPPIDFVRHMLVATTGWPRLTHLAIDECTDFGDNDGLIRFLQAQHSPIQFLSLSGARITDVILDTIASYSPYVTHVDVAKNNHITHKGASDQSLSL